MGYTHYFKSRRHFTTEEWNKICDKTRTIIANSGVPVAFDYDDINSQPEIADVIQFNGIGELGHEPFFVDSHATCFNYCKTANKPYDLVVCLVLLAIADTAPNAMEITSDGKWNDDWLTARDMYKEIFSTSMNCPWD